MKRANGDTANLKRIILYDCIAEDRQTRSMFNLLAPNADPQPDDGDDDAEFDDLEIIEYPGYS